MTEQDRIKRRYAAAVRRYGLCIACLNRQGFGCKGYPSRLPDVCTKDGQLPKFALDAAVMERFRD